MPPVLTSGVMLCWRNCLYLETQVYRMFCFFFFFFVTVIGMHFSMLKGCGLELMFELLLISALFEH